MRRTLLLPALMLAACLPAVAPAPGDGTVNSALSSSTATAIQVAPPTAPVREAMRNGSRVARSARASEDGGRGNDVATHAARYYDGITDAQLQDGTTKVLFFHAAWCPACAAHDRALQGWYAAGNVTLSTYKIDYDSSLPLRSRYGVLQQDTFVLVDGDGGKLRELTGFPSDAAIQALIGSR